MTSRSDILPALDCHAHVSPDVTLDQVRALGPVIVFAMTRSLAEAERVQNRSDASILWGCGVHPRDRAAMTAFDAGRFADLISNFVLAGEIGLDRRAPRWDVQLRVFASILGVLSQQPRISSIHSAGCPHVVVQLLATYRPAGCVLHWFTGNRSAIELATALGCAFSINAAMTDAQIRLLPQDRVLPETDFPAARLRTGVQPGDTAQLEQRLARLWNMSASRVRIQCYRNLRDLVVRAKVLDRLPETLSDYLLAV